MTFRLCSSHSELKSPYMDVFRCRMVNTQSTKHFACSGNFTKWHKFQLSDSDVRKVVTSGHLLPGRLEGSSLEKRRLEEPGRKLDFVRTLLIDNYDSYTYNIYQELSVINGLPPVVVQNDDCTWKDMYHYLYEEKAFDNIVISPGPGSPTCPADIGICLEVLLQCGDIPILGVCLGHQALGYVHGAQVVHAPEPVHGRLSEIEHNGSSIFHDIPSGRNSGFKVVRYHSLVIDADSLPKDIIPIAWTSSADTLSFLETQKNHIEQNRFIDSFSETSRNGRPWPYSRSDKGRVLMGIAHATRPHFGVQFHPESIATCHGRKIFKNFREITEDYWLRLRSSLTDVTRILAPHACQAFSVPKRRQSMIPEANLLFRRTPTSRTLSCQEDETNVFTSLNNSHQSIGAKFLKLNWRKLDGLASQVGGASNIFCKLFGKHKADNTFWLDSSSTEKDRARFSFMGGKSGSLWKQMTFRLSGQSDTGIEGYLSIEDAKGYTTSTFLKEGFFDFLNKELQSFHYEEKDFEGLPFHFYGGYVGFLGYNLKVECGMTTNHHRSKTPDACFFFADNIVVIDHRHGDVYILSIHEGSMTPPPWLEDTKQKLLNLKSPYKRKLEKQTSQPASFSPYKLGFLADKSKGQYMEDVERCLKYIKDGESYELCLTTQIRKIIGDIDSLGLYLHLREKNPAPYAALLNFSKENLCICCSSPERFLQLDRNGILEAKPIKGTIARGATEEEDERLKLQLQDSEKDQAENLMIVDLLRNDLGRVCDAGSVHVPRLMDVESYATVHTMVSTICGEKKPNISAIDCVKAAFPGGSMTGAPKLRSMELLDSIETCSRGIYSGSIGFFSYNQTFDLNIVIRTVVIHDGEASIGAGGAIVALSKPEDEYEEMLLKTRLPSICVSEFQTDSVSTD